MQYNTRQRQQLDTLSLQSQSVHGQNNRLDLAFLSDDSHLQFSDSLSSFSDQISVSFSESQWSSSWTELPAKAFNDNINTRSQRKLAEGFNKLQLNTKKHCGYRLRSRLAMEERMEESQAEEYQEILSYLNPSQ